MHRFYSIPYSPWSERARWALQRADVRYERVNYIPTVTEVPLRWELRRPTGRVTIPIFFVEGGPVLEDSLEIARWASGQAPERMPFGADAEELCAIANTILEAGRIRTTHRAIRDDTLLRANLPKFLAPTGPVGLKIGRFVARGLLKKYPLANEEACLGMMRESLGKLREALGGRETVHEAFSFSDIAVATCLAFVKPAPGRWARLSDVARVGWAEPELAEEFADLLAWRDGLYEAYRGFPSTKTH